MPSHCIRCIVLIGFLLGVGVDSFAEGWSWPVAPELLSSGFAAPFSLNGAAELSDRIGANRGLRFDNADRPVRSVSSGTVVRTPTSDRFSPGFVAPQGTYVVVEHGNGIRGVYSGLARNDETSIRPAAAVEPAQVLGTASSGGSAFSIFDVLTVVYPHPFDLLPRVGSTVPPQASSVVFSADGIDRVAGPRVSLPVGPHRLSAHLRVGFERGGESFLPRRVEFAAGSSVQSVVEISQIVPGVLAVESFQEGVAANRFESSGRGDASARPSERPEDDEAAAVRGRTPDDIAAGDMPGVAVVEIDGANALGEFFAPVWLTEAPGRDAGSDHIRWNGTLQPVGVLFEESGRLVFGVVDVPPRSVNTGVILYDHLGGRVRRNISIDPIGTADR